MKFLVMRRPIRSNPPTSKAIREHREHVLDAVNRGELDCVYSFPGGGGSVSILNANSAEEVNERVMNTSLYLASEFEIHPLSDFFKYIDDVGAALKKAGR